MDEITVILLPKYLITLKFKAMMNTQHTSGKWHAKDGQIYPTETGKTLALIPYFDKDSEEMEANARLIAAAPELLNEMIQFVEFYDRDQNREKPSFYYSFKAAIDKATK